MNPDPLYVPEDDPPTPTYRVLYVVGKLLSVLLMALILFGFGVILGAGFSVGANLVEAATPRSSVVPVGGALSSSGSLSNQQDRRTTGAPHGYDQRPDVGMRVEGPDGVSGSSPAAAAPQPTPSPSVSNRLSNIGVASWHATGRSGMYAAAGPALRVGDWRGRVVQVCAGHCISVTLNDFCQCYGTRLIDLSDEAFAQLAPLSKGLLRVEVSW